MKTSNLKKNHFWLVGIITAVIVAIGFVLMNGIPLLNVPELEEISFIEITDYKLDVHSRRLTEIDDVETALNLTNFLTYLPGESDGRELVIEMKIHLKNGSLFVISANEERAMMNGKEYRLKGDHGIIFINLAEGIFFLDEWVEGEDN
jgi:hypothetical protein